MSDENTAGFCVLSRLAGLKHRAVLQFVLHAKNLHQDAGAHQKEALNKDEAQQRKLTANRTLVADALIKVIALCAHTAVAFNTRHTAQVPKLRSAKSGLRKLLLAQNAGYVSVACR